MARAGTPRALVTPLLRGGSQPAVVASAMAAQSGGDGQGRWTEGTSADTLPVVSFCALTRMRRDAHRAAHDHEQAELARPGPCVAGASLAEGGKAQSCARGG